MALDYRLILAGDTPVNRVAERAFPPGASALRRPPGEVRFQRPETGQLTEHRRDRWWDYYPSGDQLIPG